MWETSRNELKSILLPKIVLTLHCLKIKSSSDLKNFANSRPSASNFKSFSRSLEQFFLTVGQNNFGNKISLLFPLIFRCHLLFPIFFYKSYEVLFSDKYNFSSWQRQMNLELLQNSPRKYWRIPIEIPLEKLLTKTKTWNCKAKILS